MVQRLKFLETLNIHFTAVTGTAPNPDPKTLGGNIENHIGYVSIPLGVAGPLRINGFYASGDFYIPLATHEGALVASVNRGCNLISQSGGASAICISESVSRVPCFEYETVGDAIRFVTHVLDKTASLQQSVSKTSEHCQLINIRPSLIGKEVYIGFEYETGDAAGQNMVTFATAEICRHLLDCAPVPPVNWYLEGNLSGDKKATMQSFMTARGKKVLAEVTIPAGILERITRVTPAQLKKYWEVSFMGGTLSGSIGVQGHYANVLTAIFIACGQDAACISEAAIGLTRLDVTARGDLYAAVTLPGIIVGTVGGGTWLPSQRECLKMIGCHGTGTASKLAEICAVAVLAGEISLISAIAGHEFSAAHARLGRKHPTECP